MGCSKSSPAKGPTTASGGEKIDFPVSPTSPNLLVPSPKSGQLVTSHKSFDSKNISVGTVAGWLDQAASLQPLEDNEAPAAPLAPGLLQKAGCRNFGWLSVGYTCEQDLGAPVAEKRPSLAKVRRASGSHLGDCSTLGQQDVLEGDGSEILRSEDRRTIYKTLQAGGRAGELEFYKQISAPGADETLRGFCPKYYDVLTAKQLGQESKDPNHTFIHLEDITYEMHEPALCDLKMGTQKAWFLKSEKDCPSEKRLKKWHQDTHRSSGALGWLITGIRMGAMKGVDASAGKLCSDEEAVAYLVQYIWAAGAGCQEVAKCFLSQLMGIPCWFNSPARRLQFFNSSLLFAFDLCPVDSNYRARVKMIDFAHVSAIDAVRDDCSGYSSGLLSLVAIFGQLASSRGFQLFERGSWQIEMEGAWEPWDVKPEVVEGDSWLYRIKTFRYKATFYSSSDGMQRNEQTKRERRLRRLRLAFERSAEPLLSQGLRPLLLPDVQDVRAGIILLKEVGGQFCTLVVASKGTFGFPKGKCGEGESVEQCAFRKGKEEAGLVSMSIRKVLAPRIVVRTSKRKGGEAGSVSLRAYAMVSAESRDELDEPPAGVWATGDTPSAPAEAVGWSLWQDPVTKAVMIRAWVPLEYAMTKLTKRWSLCALVHAVCPNAGLAAPLGRPAGPTLSNA